MEVNRQRRVSSKTENKTEEGNSGQATPSLRYLQKSVKEIDINNNKGYFSNICQNNLPEDFPNSK